MRPAKPTMADVARRAGVSATTVARVLYNNGYVRSETRDAVELAVSKIGYRPNVVARSLRMNRSLTIGLVVCEQRLNPFHPEVAHVIQTKALDAGYTVLTFNSSGDREMEAMGVQRLLDQHVDGVIFYTALDSANVHAVTKSGIPAVQLEREVANVGNVIAVDPTNGLEQAVDHLCSLGHRRIAYVGGDGGKPRVDGQDYEDVEHRRERTFLELLSKRGVEVPNEYVKRGPYFREGRGGPQPGYQFMRALLECDPAPTAVVCGSDVQAASALQAIAEAGLRVPTDISVIGFDDSIAEILTPALSSIAQPVEDLGRLAVEMIIKAIDSPAPLAQRATATTTFVNRASTGKAPRRR